MGMYICNKIEENCSHCRHSTKHEALNNCSFARCHGIDVRCIPVGEDLPNINAGSMYLHFEKLCLRNIFNRAYLTIKRVFSLFGRKNKVT